MAEEFRISRARVDGRGTLRGYTDVPESQKPRRASVKWFREVQLERVSWLWYPYIPFKKLTMLGGDPGMGKSFISDAIAAAVSNGEPLPGQEGRSREPYNVLMFAGEDDPSDTLKPRLISLGANLDRIAVTTDNIRFDPDGLAIVEAMIRETDAKLFIVDPIVAYLGARIDMNKANEVRPMLKALIDIAARTNSAGLIIRHLRKQGTNGSKSKDIYMGSGSGDFTAAARSEMQVSEGKDGTKYLNHIKANAGPRGKSILYSITDDEFEWGDQVERIEMSSSQKRISTTFAKEEQAKLLIYDMLKDEPGGLPSNDVYNAAAAIGISERTLKAAKKDMVSVLKTGAHWVWKLNPRAPRVGTTDAGVSPNG